jgi:aconitate hydratase
MEYFGPALRHLSVPERATITNLGAELGATTSIFPSDAQTRRFLALQGREQDFRPLKAIGRPRYAGVEEVALEDLEPLAACPSSPDNVKPEQVLIGSCANSSYRDLMVAAQALKGRRLHPRVSLEINPGSRQVLENLALSGGLLPLLEAGARVMPPGCWGCIGMGQAPPTGAVSVRTFTRNFAGRSGTKDDQVYLASPETAVAAAIFGELRDPRELGDYPRVAAPRYFLVNGRHLTPPPPPDTPVEVVRGPNIAPFPRLSAMPDTWRGEVWLKTGDNVTTDDILPAGSQILPMRSNLPAISQFAFTRLDPDFPTRVQGKSGEGLIVGGDNYGQGSSREHAALAPRYLGVRVKLVKTFARIHLANLINFGILPLTFEDPADYDRLDMGAQLELPEVRRLLLEGAERLPVKVLAADGAAAGDFWAQVALSPRQRRLIALGGALNLARERE